MSGCLENQNRRAVVILQLLKNSEKKFFVCVCELLYSKCGVFISHVSGCSSDTAKLKLYAQVFKHQLGK